MFISLGEQELGCHPISGAKNAANYVKSDRMLNPEPFKREERKRRGLVCWGSIKKNEGPFWSLGPLVSALWPLFTLL